MNDAHQAARMAYFASENLGAVGALEQEQIAAQHQQAFGRQIKFPGQRVVAEEQAAAMWRIGAHRAFVAENHTGIGAAFGAMSVHYVGFRLRDTAHDLAEHVGIACLLYTSPSPRDRQKSRMP